MNVPCTPTGSPVSAIVTGALNVAEVVRVMFHVMVVPGYIVQGREEGTNSKSGVAMVSVTGTVTVRPPPCPVRVMG